MILSLLHFLHRPPLQFPRLCRDVCKGWWALISVHVVHPVASPSSLNKPSSALPAPSTQSNKCQDQYQLAAVKLPVHPMIAEDVFTLTHGWIWADLKQGSSHYNSHRRSHLFDSRGNKSAKPNSRQDAIVIRHLTWTWTTAIPFQSATEE